MKYPHRFAVASAPVAAVLLAAGCTGAPDPPAPVPPVSTLGEPSPSLISPSPSPTPTSAGPTTPTTPTTRSSRSSTDPKPVARVPRADRLAGVRSTTVRWAGGGRLRTVPGDAPAPGKGRVYRVRVEVESGLDVDRAAFADFVLATLNDPRSWTEKGRRRFARTDSTADIRVVLASPRTSAAICRPLKTFGKLSCRHGHEAVLTMYRWVKAIPEYAGDRDGYRHYVINHEVGHTLGHGHEYCAGRGSLAPVMMQQTKGLKGCRPNPWPHP